MKRSLFLSIITFVAMLSSVSQATDFDFLLDIDRRARINVSSYQNELSMAFGLPVPQISGLLSSVASPSDAYMILRIGQLCGRPVPQVVDVYKRHRNRGWGAIAKEMGIKPGSPEFHALKNDNYLSGYDDRGKKGKGRDDSSHPGKGHGNKNKQKGKYK